MFRNKFAILIISIFAIITVSCSNTLTKTPPNNVPPTITIESFKPSTTQFITWPNIYENKVVYSNYDINNTEKRNIFLLDLINKTEKNIYSVGENRGTVIEDTKIGASRAYWVEGTIPETWQIKSYDLSNGSIGVIRESSIEKGSTLTPRLSNEGDSLVWLEGHKDANGKLGHQIYLYNPKIGLKKITDVNYVENPYDIIQIKNNTVACIERSDQNWGIRIIDINTKIEQVIHLKNKPSRPVSDGNILAWREDKSLFFLKDIKTPDKKKLIAEKIFLFDIFKGNIIYSRSQEKHHLYKYYSNMDITTCLTEQVNKERVYYEFASAYGDTTVCVYDDLPNPQTITIIKEIY